jgi:serine/threonine protein kinase
MVDILLKSKGSNEVKIADFGLSKILDEVSRMGSVCGSPGYVAPEVLLEDKYGPAVDMWSLGVIAYVLLSGVPPFFSDNIRQLFEQIMACDYRFPEQYWSGVSTLAKDFVRAILVLDPEERLSASQALEHPFLKSGGRSETLDSIKMAAVLARTKQLQREQSKAAVRTYYEGPPRPPSFGTANVVPGSPAAANAAAAASSSSSPAASHSSTGNEVKKKPTSSNEGRLVNRARFPHKWKRTTYTSPTWCGYCDAFLWGIARQGVSCRHCNLDVHSKCSKILGDHCIGPTSSSAGLGVSAKKKKAKKSK